MAAGLLAGTSYSCTKLTLNVSWEELGYDAMEIDEIVYHMLVIPRGCLMTYEVEVLMEMVQGAERRSGSCTFWSSTCESPHDA